MSTDSFFEPTVTVRLAVPLLSSKGPPGEGVADGGTAVGAAVSGGEEGGEEGVVEAGGAEATDAAGLGGTLAAGWPPVAEHAERTVMPTAKAMNRRRFMSSLPTVGPSPEDPDLE
jgi:hypothetical protein